jgi:4a-hydroxytetrahydrobiopterin dehydratase
MTKKLTEKQVAKYLTRFDEWIPNKKYTEIKRIFKTKTFLGGLSFIAKIAVHAELLDHHPDVELTYGTVTVTLSTHDEKGLTRADFELAKRIDNLQLN